MIPQAWWSRLAMDVLMNRRFGHSWRLLNRFRVLARAAGRLYGGVYWIDVPSQRPYVFTEES